MSDLVDQINAVRAQADATAREACPSTMRSRKQLARLSAQADDDPQEDRRDEGGRRDHRRGAPARAHRPALRRDHVVRRQARRTTRSRASTRSRRELGDVKQAFAKLREGELVKVNAALKAKNAPEIGVPAAATAANQASGAKEENEVRRPFERD